MRTKMFIVALTAIISLASANNALLEKKTLSVMIAERINKGAVRNNDTQQLNRTELEEKNAWRRGDAEYEYAITERRKTAKPGTRAYGPTSVYWIKAAPRPTMSEADEAAATIAWAKGIVSARGRAAVIDYGIRKYGSYEAYEKAIAAEAREEHELALGREGAAAGKAMAALLMAFYDAALPHYTKKFTGSECLHDNEIRMYEGAADNPGSDESWRVKACAKACHSKKPALSGSWDGFVALGFIVWPSNGRCYCESARSDTCTTIANGYDRYDFDSSIYDKIFDGECGGSEIRMYEGAADNPGFDEASRAKACADACHTEKSPLSGSWDGFVALGFIVAKYDGFWSSIHPSNGRCYCESASSDTCTRIANVYDRYDLAN